MDEIERPAPFFYSDVEIDSEMQLSVKIMDNIKKVKADLIAEIEKRVSDRILEQTNADLLIKLINNADSLDEAINIAALGTTYKRTGLHFDKRLEKMSNTIKYFKKNETLSFHTDDKPTHKLIIGDNYEALQNLLIQYRGKVNVIYIDPPYGKDSMGEFAATNYNNAITRDNLLSMLYPRLQLAKQLLSDDGVIFCSIDDRNQAYIKCLFDEVFGEKDHISTLVRKTKSMTGDDGNGLNIQHEYLLIYTKNKGIFEFHGEEKSFEGYSNPDNDPNGDWCSGDPSARSGSDSTYFPIENPYTKKKDYPPKGRYWAFSKDSLDKYIKEGKIKFKKDYPSNQRGFIFKRYKNKMEKTYDAVNSLFAIDNQYMNQNATIESISIFNEIVFDYPKPMEFVSKLIKYSSSSDSLILDFFAGSGTTGHAVLDLNKQDGGNRTFILCQLNEKTETTPNGIAYDVTSKRIKRIMTGECYDGTKDFKWLEKNEPYGGNLDVYEIGSVSNFEWTEGKTPFDVIDETLYGKEKFATVREKIEWVCGNFDKTQKYENILNEEE
ncbi:MAG: site-specific DNA-methyltransferase [Paludibacteraceae bacterium]|nr:site-specific DNA-methyltransferase [Paludibacteraceae bacterium]